MQKDSETSQFKRLVFGFFPATVLVCLIVFTITSLSSSFFTLSPRISLEEWSCYGKPVNEEIWNEELNNLLIAKQLAPWNADIYMDLGRMYEWQALTGASWNDWSKKSRSKASSYFKQATIYRPTWALAWSSLAQSKLLNREVDDEVFLAISNGLEFGQWQIEVQQKLLWLSIGMWSKLPLELQEQVREQIVAILPRKGSIEMLAGIALRFQWFDELVILLDDSEHLEYIESLRNDPDRMIRMLTGGKKQNNYVCRVVS